MLVRDRPAGREVGFGGLGFGVRHWRMKGPKGIFGYCCGVYGVESNRESYGMDRKIYPWS